MPFQRTVRAAKTRTSASGCSEAGGSRPALERSALCQLTDLAPTQYCAADTPIGTASANNKTITNLLTMGGTTLEGYRSYSRELSLCHEEETFALSRPDARSHIMKMSRAFVKDTDADAVEDLPDRPVSEHPNDVTAEGLAQIEAAVAAAQAAHGAAQAVGDRAPMAQASRDLRYC